MTLLFVCTGNICRSALADRLAAQWSEPGLPVASAGTRAVDGRRMHPLTAAVLERHRGTAEHFRSRQLTPSVLADAGLVLTMTGEHRDAVLLMSPRHLHSAFTLQEAATLLADLPAVRLGGPPADRPAALARRLAGARAVRRRDRAAADDIADPIGGSPSVHSRIGGQVAIGVRAVTDALRDPSGGDAPTVRMRRLPPVPTVS
jgi:protein-tyrosine phosphatase